MRPRSQVYKSHRIAIVPLYVKVGYYAWVILQRTKQGKGMCRADNPRGTSLLLNKDYFSTDRFRSNNHFLMSNSFCHQDIEVLALLPIETLNLFIAFAIALVMMPTV
jgi:hypothetical protein